MHMHFITQPVSNYIIYLIIDANTLQNGLSVKFDSFTEISAHISSDLSLMQFLCKQIVYHTINHTYYVPR